MMMNISIIRFLCLIALCEFVIINGFKHHSFAHTSQGQLFQTLQQPLQMATVPFPIPPSEIPARVMKSLPKINFQQIKVDKVTKFLQFGTVAAFFVSMREKILSKFNKAVVKMEDGWKDRGSGTATQRTIEVWTFAASFIFRFLKTKKLAKTDPEAYRVSMKADAIVLRDKILELGPTFIKLGQLLSTRIDVLSKEYIQELSLLQDQVPGFSGERAISIIERELGKPIDQLFDKFSATPLAAASLGQVHVAEKDGKQLVVKIQREGLKDLFDKDLKNIKLLAVLLDKFDPKSDGAARDWATIYDESARLLYQEIDYVAEAGNAQRFKDNFANVPWVQVPQVYPDMTTETIVTMDYLPGIKVNDIEKIEEAGIDRQLLAKRSAEAYLTQICRHGFFHCDPHPGNVACSNELGGTLIFYDFGMMDELKPEVRSGLVDLIFSIFENDPKEACNALEDIGCLKRGVDRVSIEKIARVFLQEFSSGVKKGEKWTNQLPKEEQKELRRKRRAQLGADLFSVGSDVPFKFPPTFTFVFRAFTSLDGIGKGLDAGYDLTRLSKPYLKELVDLRDGSAFLSGLKAFGKKVGLRPIDISQAIGTPRSIAKLEDIVTRMEQGDLKIRVRDLETENSFKRLKLVQDNMGYAIAASAFLNAGLVISAITPAGQVATAGRAGLALAGVCASQFLLGVVKIKALDKKLASFD